MLLCVLVLAACAGGDVDSSACANGDQQCSDDGNSVEECTGGDGWSVYQTCDIGCEVNSGVPACVEASSDHS